MKSKPLSAFSLNFSPTNSLVLDNLEEKSLLAAVASGNESAFTELFISYHPFLCSHILRIVESVPLMEEIVQDVFLKIWLSRETLLEVQDFKSYLAVVSRNQALTALNRVLNEIRKKNKYIQDGFTPADREADEGDLIRLTLIDEAIDSLSQRQKEVYLLHRHLGLTYLQIAERLGIGRETVKTHIENAVQGITRYIKQRLTIMMILFEIIKN